VSVDYSFSRAVETHNTTTQSSSIYPESPAPFVSTRYLTKNGLATPQQNANGYFDNDESEFSDTNYRRNLLNNSARPEGFESEYHSFARLPSSASLESNGRARIPSTSTPNAAGWSKAVVNVVGTVVGKVWQFCKAGSFSGFGAGGGEKYAMDAGHTEESELEKQRNDFWDSKIAQKAAMFGVDSANTFLPGQFPGEESMYIVDYMDHATPESTPPRASKRRHIDSEKGDKSWVVVEETASNAATPVARPRYSMSTASSAGRKVSNPSRLGARAVPKRSLPTRPSLVSHAGSPGLRSTAPASYASPRSPGGSRIPVAVSYTSAATPAVVPSSPAARKAAEEAKKWALKKKKEDLEADRSMRRLNEQMQAMIREANEALGTTVEVHDEGGMAGDDDVDMFSSRGSLAGSRTRAGGSRKVFT
jgi:hypothetical protein